MDQIEKQNEESLLMEKDYSLIQVGNMQVGLGKVKSVGILPGRSTIKNWLRKREDDH